MSAMLQLSIDVMKAIEAYIQNYLRLKVTGMRPWEGMKPKLEKRTGG